MNTKNELNLGKKSLGRRPNPSAGARSKPRSGLYLLVFVKFDTVNIVTTVTSVTTVTTITINPVCTVVTTVTVNCQPIISYRPGVARAALLTASSLIIH